MVARRHGVPQLEELAPDAHVAPARGSPGPGAGSARARSGASGGRPGPRRRPKAAHFRRTSSRCQRSSVSGRTGKRPHSARGRQRLSARQEQAVARPPARPLDLPAQHAHLVPERQQLNRLRPCCRGADEREAQEPADEAVHQGEEHRASVLPQCSSPTEYSYPTGTLGTMVRLAYRATPPAGTGRTTRLGAGWGGYPAAGCNTTRIRPRMGLKTPPVSGVYGDRF